MTDRFARQSFLGSRSHFVIEHLNVGVVGLGGGGSQITQQLAHIGFRHFALYDSDRIDRTNLNRLVGATDADIIADAYKVGIATRLIHGITPGATVAAMTTKWQNDPDALKLCDVVFGAVDSFAERSDLEALCRRYTIPYIDIGMDIHVREEEPPRMGGQVILSMPGSLCMRCIGFLSPANLAAEARKYGQREGAPQVVWAVGILASTAVGIAMDMISGWTGVRNAVSYYSLDGNTGTLTPHIRLQFLDWAKPCPHYPIRNAGDPVYRNL
jgi:hypothetical protein